ncbi:MAG: hypothetical protein F6J93_11865 [Oscillatoria sp. SIO1A7]|nr:hypothetical protein [Oscillatoria sp. SIO1A7]
MSAIFVTRGDRTQPNFFQCPMSSPVPPPLKALKGGVPNARVIILWAFSLPERVTYGVR